MKLYIYQHVSRFCQDMKSIKTTAPGMYDTLLCCVLGVDLRVTDSSSTGIPPRDCQQLIVSALAMEASHQAWAWKYTWYYELRGIFRSHSRVFFKYMYVSRCRLPGVHLYNTRTYKQWEFNWKLVETCPAYCHFVGWPTKQPETVSYNSSVIVDGCKENLRW